MKVLIGFVTYSGHGFCRDVFFRNLAEISYPVEFFIVTNSGENDAQNLRQQLQKHNLSGEVVVDAVSSANQFDIIVSGRNKIREYFLRGDWEFLHMMDSDVLASRNRIEVFLDDEKKLSHRKHVIGGWYFGFEMIDDKRHLRPMIWGPTDDSPCRRLTIAEALIPKLFPVVVLGLGLTFISREVVAAIPFRVDPKGVRSEDTLFFKDCLDAGIQPFCDTRISGWHLLEPLDAPKNKLMNPQYHVRLARKGRLKQ